MILGRVWRCAKCGVTCTPSACRVKRVDKSDTRDLPGVERLWPGEPADRGKKRKHHPLRRPRCDRRAHVVGELGVPLDDGRPRPVRRLHTGRSASESKDVSCAQCPSRS